MPVFPGARPTIRARLRGQYPCRIVENGGVKADLSQGTLTIGLGYEDLIVDNAPSPPNYAIAARRMDTGEYRLIGAGVLGGDSESVLSAPHSVRANVTDAVSVPQDVSSSDVLDMISTYQGSVLTRSLAGWTALPPGDAGQTLTSGGSGADPYWDTLPARTVSTSAPSGIPLDGQEWIVVDA